VKQVVNYANFSQVQIFFTLARFFERASPAQKNRAFRSKSSELPMQFLRAFRYNPSRAHQRQPLELPFGNSRGA
jgi:hypothetical protein